MANIRKTVSSNFHKLLDSPLTYLLIAVAILFLFLMMWTAPVSSGAWAAGVSSGDCTLIDAFATATAASRYEDRNVDSCGKPAEDAFSCGKPA